ncbi:MAG: malonic semialdehyde reductase [Deltaproteobacteria bacterium]|jgi:3-hydroxypropanoate dehydrogenase|nr:malonic semialdehyde reductase [Deltaproteobacteria bacterium]
MTNELEAQALDQIFLKARTYIAYTPDPLEDKTITAIYDLMKWCPTCVNCQAGRFVFVRSPDAKKRLIPCLFPGNIPKVESAAATVIVAHDTRFFEYLASQWLAYDASPMYRDNPPLAQETAFRNGSLGGAYLIIAARALGLDCGPMSGFDNAKVDQEFFRDGRLKSNFLINIGHGKPDGHYPRGPRLKFEEVVEVL